MIQEAQALLAQKHSESLTTINKNSEENGPEDAMKVETLKRKTIDNLELDIAANTVLSPKQRLSDVSDVHSNTDSPRVIC